MQDNIICDDFIMDGNEIWFPSKDNNTFYYANLDTKEVKCLWELHDEKPFVTRLFRGILRYKNKIIMFPCEADNIAVYDISANTIMSIKLEERLIKRSYWHNPCKTLFWKAIQVGQYIYAGGMGYKGIIKLNPETLEIKCIDDWSDKVESSIESDCDEVYIEDCLVDENYIYFPLCCMDAILRLNLDTDTTELLMINSGLSGFAGIEKWRNSFILLPRQAEEIVIYNLEYSSIKKIKILYEIDKFLANRVPFERHFILNDKLYVFKAHCNKNYIIDLKKEKVFENIEEPFKHKKVGAIYFVNDTRLAFIEVDTRVWAIYNIKEQKYEQRFQLKMDAWERKRNIRLNMEYSKEQTWQENDELSLKEYLNYIADLKI